MRTLTASRGETLRRDPAPSRLQYRVTRLWLSPSFRRFVTFILPVFLLVFLGGVYVAQPAQQKMFREWVGQVRASIEARPEFQIRQMSITGASPVLADEIRRRVPVEFPVSWLRLDKDQINQTISSLDAVESVRVNVELGGALRLNVTERTPAILWRDRSGLMILDGTGHRIAYIDRREGRPDLPLITGDGASAAVPQALELWESLGHIKNRVRGLTRQGERRWDVVLDRNQIIQLPESEPVRALQRVLAMDAAADVLTRDVVAVDMRVAERPTIRLGPDAMEYQRTTRAFEKGLASQ
ncbi:cell division protein FtsQ/DivIB [Qingshengfaniella alkalisoli]|uniref:Cell division protein FtsQ n=1 Tax=Qingshengfaniella alkalisoli TaxID=2599296 RepID=A0A5B8IXT4_9RHOB|nr:cell division protein FtsQ/DivIB [Qingshengfaniella alkalisoli]QDY69448.1 FtsQ-type POTRA domain-containing protein [Qingshengfaniella alkalisoli]